MNHLPPPTAQALRYLVVHQQSSLLALPTEVTGREAVLGTDGAMWRDDSTSVLVGALASGMTVRAAAYRCGVSVRTAHRRIAAARLAVGAPSTGALLALLHPRTGGRDLTERQRQVLELVARGATTAVIAADLGISPATVESHLRVARQRLGARTRWQAATMAGFA